MNEVYFGGALTSDVVNLISELPVDRDDARAFVERMFRLMRAARFTAADLSILQAEILAGLLSRLLPGTWEGRVPPITIAGRHRKLDQLVLDVAAQDGLSPTFIDIACGFPPLTTVDTASTLETWQVTGVDRSLPAYLVNDSDGNYATFDDEGRALYFQPLVPTAQNWMALLGDWEGSRRRFELLLEDLLAERQRQGDPQRVERADAILDVEPVRSYEHDRLRFVRADLADINAPPAGVVRCFNMLLYFDGTFRREALARLAGMVEPDGLLICGTDWVYTTEARYFTYRKRDGRLADAEFSFSLDNVAPLGIIPWYTLHDGDYEAGLLAELVTLLRTDRRFMGAFMARSDALRAEMNLMPRGEDGYYAATLPDVPPAELWMRAAKLGDTLAEDLGAEAVAVLARHGLQARMNSVGHLSVAGTWS
jgi:hypothetical protein